MKFKAVAVSIMVLLVPFAAGGVPFHSLMDRNAVRQITAAPHSSSLYFPEIKSQFGYSIRDQVFDSEDSLQYLTGWFRGNEERRFIFTSEHFRRYLVEKRRQPDFVRQFVWSGNEGYGLGNILHGNWWVGCLTAESVSSQPVPEPGTLLMMGLGMFGLACHIRSRCGFK